MADQTDTPPPAASPEASSETPMQRALRLKKAAQAAKRPSGEQLGAKQNAKAPVGHSQPWMKK